MIWNILCCKARAGTLWLHGHGSLRTRGMARPEPWGPGALALGARDGGAAPRPSHPPLGPARPFPGPARPFPCGDSGFRLSLRPSLPGAERGCSGRCRAWRGAPGSGVFPTAPHLLLSGRPALRRRSGSGAGAARAPRGGSSASCLFLNVLLSKLLTPTPLNFFFLSDGNKCKYALTTNNC